MEVCLCQNSRTCCSVRRQILQPCRRDRAVRVPAGTRKTNPPLKLAARCAKLGSLPEAMEEEWEMEKEAAEWVRAGRVGEKCGGEGRGLAEVLECLEREAIMGEDQGRDPNDYNRRAQIFDKSSRVFQALKERSSASPNVYTCYICCHRLIGTTRLHLVVGRLALPASSTLELIGCRFFWSSTLTFKQSFRFYLFGLLPPLIACHLRRTHVHKPLGLELSKKNFPAEIRVLRVLEIENQGSILGLLGPSGTAPILKQHGFHGHSNANGIASVYFIRVLFISLAGDLSQSLAEHFPHSVSCGVVGFDHTCQLGSCRSTMCRFFFFFGYPLNLDILDGRGIALNFLDLNGFCPGTLLNLHSRRLLNLLRPRTLNSWRRHTIQFAIFHIFARLLDNNVFPYLN